jgi:RNA polymerase sigma factor for flagellar operon FliA
MQTVVTDHVVRDDTRKERNELIVEQLRIVRAIALNMASKLPAHIEVDDLIHAGVLGLIAAAEKFDGARNVAFGAYAKHRVRGAILDYLRKEDWLTRDSRRKQKRIDGAKDELAAEAGAEPGAEAISARLGVSLAEFHRMSQEVDSAVVGSRWCRMGESEPPKPEPSARWTDRPDAISARNESRTLLASAAAQLPERYRLMLTLIYDRDMTMKQVGGVLNVNESRVSQMHKTAMSRMASALHERGIHSCGSFANECLQS